MGSHRLCCRFRHWPVRSLAWNYPRPRCNSVIVAAVVLSWVMAAGNAAQAADRTTCFLPLGSDESAAPIPAQTLLPAAAFSEGLSGGTGPTDALLQTWKKYLRVWQAHHQHPADPAIRRYLALPLGEAVEVRARRGRSAPRQLGWRPGSYQQIDTPHFQLLTRADPESSRRIAIDLERCYWVWTQLFFPLWDGRQQVEITLRDLGDAASVPAYLADRPSRLAARTQLRVVLFRDAAEYQRTLGKNIPGIERSTGFYSDESQTTFLYAADDEAKDDAAATRRHELTHQLFREATRSELGRRVPGGESEFWLVEGIAGYMESLVMTETLATVGGWDSPRLQFARYRMLAGGDVLPWHELRRDGRSSAQGRADLARWYAHAIAHTHLAMDGPDADSRRAVYRMIAELYELPTELPSAELQDITHHPMSDFLRVDDQTLIENPPDRQLEQLCLASCEVTERGLASLEPAPALNWLDLSRLPVGSAAVNRLLIEPSALQQLSLEATRIDPAIGERLGRAANLRELDLSWTSVDDSVVAQLSDADELTTLWLTGCPITDASVPILRSFPRLQALDVQRTKISEAGLAELQTARPDINLNPLQLLTPEQP